MELDDNFGAIAGRTVAVRDAIGCRYLQAVIKETCRLHPGNGLGLTRDVPKGGLIIAGRFFRNVYVSGYFFVLSKK